MSNEFSLNAELRSDEGKGASRRLRRLQNKVPAIRSTDPCKLQIISFAPDRKYS